MADSGSLKRSKLSSTSEAIIDRISTLPDSLLSHIVSFLPTKYAVRTSVLSTRWKFIWTSITNLDFDDESYLMVIKETDIKHKMFTLFVYRVLLFLKPPRIPKFHLKCTSVGSHGSLHINSWVSTAKGHGVEEMDLKIMHQYPSSELKEALPRTIFNCKTLAVLKLAGPLKLNLSTYSVSLPSLKILHLIRVIYEDEESVRKLFCSCPVLEDLVIEGYGLHGTFNISSASLIRLKICFRGNIWYHPVLQINTPALEYLDLKDNRSWRVSLTNMVSLVEANVDASICKRPNYDDGDLPNYDHILFELLEGLSNTKFLSLSGQTMKALSFTTQLDPPKFPNLKRLKVSFTNRNREWKSLSSLLANSVNLEELVCKQEPRSVYRGVVL